MKSYVLRFGLISGLLLAAMTAGTVPLAVDGRIGFDHGQILGYTTMILAFVLVFFGIRSYREEVGGGTITFGRAFKVGILITLITSATYVATWLVVYYNFIPDFAEKYAAYTLDTLRAEGASAEKIAEAGRQMQQFKEWSSNPLLNAAMTFMEVFPVGLIVTLISAAILRKRGNEAALRTPVEA